MLEQRINKSQKLLFKHILHCVFVSISFHFSGRMARNKREELKYRGKVKGIWIEAKKCWRNKKAKAECLQKSAELACESEVKPGVVAEPVQLTMSCQLPKPEQGFAEPETAKHCEAKKSPIVVDVVGSTSKTKKSEESRTWISALLKEINLLEVVGSDLFGLWVSWHVLPGLLQRDFSSSEGI